MDLSLYYDDDILKTRLRHLATATSTNKNVAVRMLRELFDLHGWEIRHFPSGSWEARLMPAEQTRRAELVKQLGGGKFVYMASYSPIYLAEAYWLGTGANKFHIETMLQTLPRENRLENFYRCFAVPFGGLPVVGAFHSKERSQSHAY